MEELRTLRPADLASVMRVYRDLLRSHQDQINRLNVYPVPDGDTGTNMALTVEAVVSEIDAKEAERNGTDADSSFADVCGAMAHGSLMGARGNSGVILSQLLRGISGTFHPKDQKERVPASGGDEDVKGDGALLADALVAASEAAHKAVLRPVEGTILTVARKAADGAREAADAGATLVSVAASAREHAADALARTPEQLPALARAGVVDAGGAGYLLLFDALLNVAGGREVPAPEPLPEGAEQHDTRIHAFDADGFDPSDEANTGLRYEVMYLLEATDDTIPAFKDVWAGLGDSIVVVGGDGLWNCHIHTDDVGGAIEAALDAGRPRNIRVTDLAEQVEEERWVREGGATTPSAHEGPVPRTAVVAVATGAGIARIFRSLGVHHIVPGGQSMNPSTEQILKVIDSVASPEVVLLPNNENIFPVAMQVVELANRPVRVVPTGGIVEGFAALLEYDPESSADNNASNMSESATRIVAAEVTQAVRDAESEAGPIEKGDWIGLSRHDIEVVGKDLFEVTSSLLDKLIRPEHELVTLIEGEGARLGVNRQLAEWLDENHPDVSVEVHHGGQPLYPYLVSIE
ncbi:MAG: DAK2 domain-containing protein [Acidimicrobiales bacterium]